MTYEACLYDFWNSFGIPAYPSTANLEDVVFPYMVYEIPYPSNMEASAGTVNVYYYSESEALPNQKAKQIKDAISDGGTCREYNDGRIWIMLGSPEQINLVYADNPAVKQRQLNITYEVHKKY